MGASNVAMVFTYWAHLDHREVRALTYMANISMDADAPPVYFGGWEALAVALGADPHGNPQSGRRTAVRVLGALSKAGAIVSSGQARTGVRAEYALALDPEATFKPVGKGRNVKWTRVERETATGTHNEQFTPGFTPAGVLTESSVATARGTQGETARGIHPETATGMQGETATVPNLRQLRVPQGTTSGTTEEYLEEKLEEQHQSVSQLTREPTQKNADAKNLSQKIDDEEQQLTEDQERQRQMRALQELMKAEQH